MRPVLSLFLDMNSKHVPDTIHTESLKKAVIYARFSSAAQNEQSIEGQLTVCHDYAERNGYMVVGEYIDRAISGRSDERPDFQRMINDARTGAFQYVLVYKLDRFSRNRYDSAIYKVQLKKYGVKVISCMENIGDNPESIILEAVLEASAEYYSIDLSQKVKRGMIESAKKGRLLGNACPLGYKNIDAHLVPDPAVAPHVTWAFRAYADGMRKKDIVAELNRRGIRSHRGGDLTLSSLQTVFRNEKYLGILDQHGYRFENAHEALIDKETFDKVQEMAKKNRHTAAKNKAPIPYLLTGKLFCGLCGEPMRGVSGTGRSGNIWYYYSCRGRKTNGCKKRHEKKDYLEWYVCEQTVEYVLDPARLDLIAKAVVEEYQKSFGTDEISAAEKRIQQLDNQMNKIVDMLLDVPESGRPALYAKMEQVGAEKTAAEEDLSKLKIANKVVLTEKSVKDWLRNYCKGDLMDLKFRERMIDTLVNSVYLFDDKIIIYYNVEGGEQVSFIEMLEDVGDAPSPDADLMLPENGSYPNRLSGENHSESEPRYIYKRGVFGFLLKRK